MDRRHWSSTERPDERIAVSTPLPGVRVMSVMQSDRRWAEFHEAYTVCLIHDDQTGVGAEWMCGRSPVFRTDAGQLMVMELGECHRTVRVLGKANFSVIQIAPSVFRRLAESVDPRGNPSIRAASLDDASLRQAVTQFVAYTAAGVEPLALEHGLIEVVCTLLKCSGDDRTKHDPVVHRGIRRARDAIREQFSALSDVLEPPRLEQLARVSGLSAAHFSHAFRDWLGISPHAYLNLCRLSTGRRLLEQGTSVTEAAAALGFADLPHFTRRFRQQFGLAPSAWQATRRNEH